MSLSPAEAAALPPAEREFLDLSQAQVLRRRISPADRAMTAAEAGAFQRGDVAGPAPAPDPASFAAPPPLAAPPSRLRLRPPRLPLPTPTRAGRTTESTSSTARRWPPRNTRPSS